METVNFYPKTFRNIPRQDNPAFDDGAKCNMIVMDRETDHAVVLRIAPDPHDTVTPVASFWLESDAVDYCQYLTTGNAQKGME